MRLERSNQKNIVYTVGTGYFLKFGFRFRIAVINQVIKFCQRFMQIIAIAHFIHIISDGVGDIPQTFQRVTFQITQFTDGSIAQFWPRLNEQYEQHPVHIAQAFQCQLSGIHGMLF